jgi:hypothetical protein
VLGTRDRAFALFYGHAVLGKRVNASSLQIAEVADRLKTAIRFSIS